MALSPLCKKRPDYLPEREQKITSLIREYN
jgi:hypothetical protein